MLKTYVIEFSLENGLKCKVRYNARDIYSINKWIELNRYTLINIKECGKYEKCDFMISVYGEQYKLFTDYKKMLEHIEYVKTQKTIKNYVYNSCYYDIDNKETYLRNTVI